MKLSENSLKSFLNEVLGCFFTENGLLEIFSENLNLTQGKSFCVPHVHNGLEIKILCRQLNESENFWEFERAVFIPNNIVHESFNKDEIRRTLSLHINSKHFSLVFRGVVIVENVSSSLLNKFGVSVVDLCGFFDMIDFSKPIDSSLCLHMEILLKSLFSTLYRFVDSDSMKTGVTDPIGKVADYIQRYYYRSGLTVEHVAEYIGLTPNYLVLIFRQEIGITIKQYLTKTRLEEAEKLLKTNRFLVKDVALLTGWSCPYYFSNCYKKQFKVSPSILKQGFMGK